jgi:hypothetical protein
LRLGLAVAQGRRANGGGGRLAVAAVPPVAATRHRIGATAAGFVVRQIAIQNGGGGWREGFMGAGGRVDHKQH